MRKFIFLLFFWMLLIAHPVHGILNYYSLIVCEGRSSNITCPPETHINLIRANFGRFSITTCNEHGNAGMSVDCMSTISFRVLSDVCQNKNECFVEASTSQFGDGCPGSTKYLEVHYQCLSDHKKGSRTRKPFGTTTTTTSTTPSTTATVTTTSVTTRRTTNWIHSGASSNSRPKSSDTNENTIDLGSAKDSFSHPSVSEQSSHSSSSSSSFYQSSFSPSPTTPSSSVAWPDRPPFDTPVQSTASSEIPVTKSNSSLTSISSGQVSSFTNHPHVAYNSSALCPALHSRSLFWNWTLPGTLVRQPCPQSDEGTAKWLCSIDPYSQPAWVKPEADLSGCKSRWLISLEGRMRSADESTLTLANDLRQATRRDPLYGGDLAPVIDLIDQLVSKIETGLSDYSEDKQFQFVQETLKIMNHICSNLLEDFHRDAWYDLSPVERTRSAAALITDFERITLIFMETVTSTGDYYQTSDNLYMSVHAHRLDQLPNGLRLPKDRDSIFSPHPGGEGGSRSGDNDIINSPPPPAPPTGPIEVDDQSNPIYLPRISLSDLNRRSMVRIGYIVYGKMGHLLDPIITEPYVEPSDNNDNDLTGNGKSESANKLIESGTDNDQSIVATIVNSDVIGILVPKESSSMILLREPVEITFRHLIIENITNARCVFWDASQWSEFGCITVASNETHTMCRCNHLTNFAVLVDFTRQESPGYHGLILHSLTQIGCTIASFCLIVCLLTFIVFRNLRSERTFIHTNLCLCLLAVQLIFILAIDKVTQSTFCSIIAATLHYCLLTSFLWMLMEGLHLYYMLIEVFEPASSRLPIYFILSYVSPLTVIGLTLGLSKSPYGPVSPSSSLTEISPGTSSSTICWLSSSVIYQSFVLPLGLILASNLVFLAIAQCAMCKHISNSFVHKEVKHQEKLKQIRRQAILIARYKQLMLWARSSLALVLLLAITWSLAIVYITFPGLVTAYLFTGANVFQGIFIFVFTCLTNDQIRREYVRLVSRGSCLPWFCCSLCSNLDQEKVTSPNQLDRATFFHSSSLNDQHSSPTTTTGTTTKPSSSGSSMGGGHGVNLYPNEVEEPMISSSHLLSTRKMMTTLEDGTTRIYDHSADSDLNCELMETRALMEGLSHSDATSGPMRPIIMRGDVSLQRVPGEHLYECIPEDAYHVNNLHGSSGLPVHVPSTVLALKSNPTSNAINHSYHQYHQPSSFYPASHHQHHPLTTYHPHHPAHSHQTFHPHAASSSDYQQLHSLFTNKPHGRTISRDLKLNNTLDRRSNLTSAQRSLVTRASCDELLPAIVRDNTRSPYGVTSLTNTTLSNPQPAHRAVQLPTTLSASSSTSSASSSPTCDLPKTVTTRLNIPVSPKRVSSSNIRTPKSKKGKPQNAFAKLKGNQIVTTTTSTPTTGTINSQPC